MSPVCTSFLPNSPFRSDLFAERIGVGPVVRRGSDRFACVFAIILQAFRARQEPLSGYFVPTGPQTQGPQIVGGQPSDPSPLDSGSRAQRMPQVVIRNLDDEVVARLKEQAKRHHRSLEGELRQILTEAATPSRAELAQRAQAIAQALDGRWTGDATALVREDRDR
jgi:antitoxin FitA